MTYDWHGEVSLTPLSLEWFDAIDERFLQGARLEKLADKLRGSQPVVGEYGARDDLLDQ